MPIVSKYHTLSFPLFFDVLFLLSVDDGGGGGSLERGSTRELITEKILDRRECVCAQLCVVWEENLRVESIFSQGRSKKKLAERKDDRLLLRQDATSVTLCSRLAAKARVSKNSRSRNMLITIFVLSLTPGCVCHYSTRDMTFSHRPAFFGHDDDVFCLLNLQWSVSLFRIFVSRQCRDCPSPLSSPSFSFMQVELCWTRCPIISYHVTSVTIDHLLH